MKLYFKQKSVFAWIVYNILRFIPIILFSWIFYIVYYFKYLKMNGMNPMMGGMPGMMGMGMPMGMPGMMNR